MERKKIFYIFSNWGNAHQIARMLGLEKEGIISEILGYVRDIYPGGINREIIELGQVSPGSYLNRIFKYCKAFVILLRKIPAHSTTYVFGFDNLVLLILSSLFSFKKIKIIYEIADIQPFQLLNGYKGEIIRFIEKKLFRYVDLAVVTSPEFITGFYQEQGYPKVSYTWLENKMNEFALNDVVSSGIKKAELTKRDSSTIVIGYFGMVRCQRAIELLNHLTKLDKRFKVIIRGVLMPNVSHLVDLLESNPSISFLGSYISPTDLQDMYAEIDLAWVAYPYTGTNTGNWKWARTNRFYEAGYFQVPMIASFGTQDGSRVQQAEIGTLIDLGNIESALLDLKDINKKMIQKWKANITDMPKSTFVVTDDYDRLKKRLLEEVF